MGAYKADNQLFVFAGGVFEDGKTSSTAAGGTIWVETEEDNGDFKPMNTKYGECVQWDGSNLTHGNKKNTTSETRISVDFRVIPISTYKPSTNNSINTKMRFKIGEYYEQI